MRIANAIKNPNVPIGVSYLEFLVRAESEDSESVDNILFEECLLRDSVHEGRLLTGSRRSRRPRRPRVSVPRMTGLGTESESEATAAASTAGGILILAAVAVLFIVRRSLSRLL